MASLNPAGALHTVPGGIFFVIAKVTNIAAVY